MEPGKDRVSEVRTGEIISARFDRIFLAKEVVRLAQEIIQAKNLLKTHHLIKPGEKVFAERDSLRELLKQEMSAKEQADLRANQAKDNASKAEQRYAELNKMFNNLSAKVMKDFGQRYLEEAIATDSTVIESEVEDANEDDKQ
jgi:uncharacterized protein (DUF3084 family)